LSLTRNREKYLVEISDTGPGIPAESQPHIFERFYRADKARSRPQAANTGAGLGLAIARWIAEAHKGSLHLARSDQNGSTFVATLPAPARK
jgi:signal transduction histidine kinase